MKEFSSRLKISLINSFKTLVPSLIILACVLLFGIVVFIFPAWLISKVSEDLAAWWVMLALVSIPIVGERENIRKWFVWQFIEPFKK